MSSSKLIFGLICFLSSITFLAQKVSSASYLSTACSRSKFYQPNSPYERNLNNLLVDLNSKTPPTGFSTISKGNKPDRTHGLALCRGDISREDCRSCVLTARTEIRKRCPNQKEAIIWYNECFLKYSDDWFRGENDDNYMFSMSNQASDINQYFVPMTKELLLCLTEKAHEAQNMYATKEMEFGDNKKLYGLVQCTRDLSKEDCKRCLVDIITNELPRCCARKIGGRALTGSCNFRYELFPFYDLKGYEMLPFFN